MLKVQKPKAGLWSSVWQGTLRDLKIIIGALLVAGVVYGLIATETWIGYLAAGAVICAVLPVVVRVTSELLGWGFRIVKAALVYIRGY